MGNMAPTLIQMILMIEFIAHKSIGQQSKDKNTSEVYFGIKLDTELANGRLCYIFYIKHIRKTKTCIMGVPDTILTETFLTNSTCFEVVVNS